MLARACYAAARPALAARTRAATCFATNVNVNANAIAASSVSRRWFAEAQQDKPVTEGMLRFRLSAPHAVVFPEGEIQSLTVPGVSGEFDVNADYVPTVAELQPGVVRVQTASGDEQEYFINGGFCVVHKNNTCDVTAIEAIKVDEIDGEAAKAALRQFEADLAAARDEEATTEAEIGIETATALCAAAGVAP